MAVPFLIKQYLKSKHQHVVDRFLPVSGGSINHAFQYAADGNQFFLKYNSEINGILRKEVEGLLAIASCDCIETPKVVDFVELEGFEVLILPYIRTVATPVKSWEIFGQQLAQMHAKPCSFYGWYDHNYIGSLVQYNNRCSSFSEFFLFQRLEPQVQIAIGNNYLSKREITQFERLFAKLNEILPDARPSLVHGDLWSGNVMIGENGTPYLIDPAIHYSFREIDIAFSHLFGGFERRFYEAYSSEFPLDSSFEQRISLYNLYPLLVHLNMFGESYHRSVIQSLYEYV